MAPGSVEPAGVVHQGALCSKLAPSLSRLCLSEFSTFTLFIYLLISFLFMNKLVFIYFGLKVSQPDRT